MALLEATGLSKHFGALTAVDDLSLTVEPGEAYGLVGPDGAGKTTAMRIMVGALSLESGQVRILGHDLARHAEEARACIGYLPQRFSLYGDLTVYENLAFFGSVRGVERQALAGRTRELLGFVGLAGFEDRLASALSGGMKQKLGLACALIHRPPLLLLDEPTGGVDPVTRQDFWQLIIRLLAEGTGVLVSTPYMDEAVRCSRLGFMVTGRLLTTGSPRELSEPSGRPHSRAESSAQRDSTPGLPGRSRRGGRCLLWRVAASAVAVWRAAVRRRRLGTPASCVGCRRRAGG